MNDTKGSLKHWTAKPKRRTFHVFGRKMTVDDLRHHDSDNTAWGRFGGGWDWKIGLQASKGWKEVIVELLVFSVRISP